LEYAFVKNASPFCFEFHASLKVKSSKYGMKYFPELEKSVPAIQCTTSLLSGK
jgi:hypothetical protein